MAALGGLRGRFLLAEEDTVTLCGSSRDVVDEIGATGRDAEVEILATFVRGILVGGWPVADPAPFIPE